MARPRKTADTQKSATIIFRITEGELMRLATKAQEGQIRVNELARRLVMSRAEKVTIVTSRKADPAVIKRLERIGNNLNQLVRSAHLKGQISPDIPRLCAHLETIILDEIED